MYWWMYWCKPHWGHLPGGESAPLMANGTQHQHAPTEAQHAVLAVKRQAGTFSASVSGLRRSV